MQFVQIEVRFIRYHENIYIAAAIASLSAACQDSRLFLWQDVVGAHRSKHAAGSRRAYRRDRHKHGAAVAPTDHQDTNAAPGSAMGWTQAGRDVL